MIGLRPDAGSLLRLRRHLRGSEFTSDQRRPLRLSAGAKNLASNPVSATVRRARGPAGCGKSLGLAARAASAMSIPAAAHRRPAASFELSTLRWWSGSSRTRRPCPDPGGINPWVVVGLAVVLAGQSTRGGHARGGGDTGDRGLRGNARRWSVKCKRFYGMASAGLSRSRAGSHCRDIRRSRVPRWPWPVEERMRAPR
jgi:hypothetical protein